MQRLRQLLHHPYVQQLRDVRVLGLYVFCVIVVLVSWSGVKVIQTNYELQKQISRLEQENSVHELENTNLRLSNQYLQTDQFLELAARRQFGRGAPGEKLIIVPKEVAYSYAAGVTAEETGQNRQPDSKPKYQQNFEAWINFFLHRTER